MTTSQYAYDALGRRIGKYDAAALETTYYYYNDQWQILAEHDGTAFGTSYVYGNYIDEVLMAGDGADDLYYAHDHLYSPAALLDDTGAVVERYEYDAYGKAAILAPNYELRTTSLYANAYTFTGRQLDLLDNGNLHHMHYRHRDYRPQLGRFMQHDPLGVVPVGGQKNLFIPYFQYVDGVDLYEYTRSRPVIIGDPYGLSVKRDMGVYIINPYRLFPLLQLILGLMESGELGELTGDPYISCLDEGYYRHCFNSCVLNRIIDSPITTLLIALQFGNDFPWQNPEADDIRADLVGILRSRGIGTCKSLCEKSYDDAVKAQCDPCNPLKRK